MQLNVTPFLKWAGGKRWLTQSLPEIFPESYNRYIEPFLGGGAVFFHLSPSSSILSDINEELIGTYKAIQHSWELVWRYLKRHQQMHSDEYYYKIRSSKPRSESAKAARMLYLNRTCWNGLYRVNLKGEFNVPRGTKDSVILNTDNFESVASLLSGASIQTADFEHTIDQAKLNDFVFIDPPYTIKHNLNGFIKYNETLFAWEDQERLRRTVDRAVLRGAKVLILNAAHDSIRELYTGYNQIELTRSSVLSASPKFRGSFGELAVQCW